MSDQSRILSPSNSLTLCSDPKHPLIFPAQTFVAQLIFKIKRTKKKIANAAIKYSWKENYNWKLLTEQHKLYMLNSPANIICTRCKQLHIRTDRVVSIVKQKSHAINNINQLRWLSWLPVLYKSLCFIIASIRAKQIEKKSARKQTDPRTNDL